MTIREIGKRLRGIELLCDFFGFTEEHLLTSDDPWPRALRNERMMLLAERDVKLSLLSTEGV